MTGATHPRDVLRRSAQVISLLGHPALTTSAFLLYVVSRTSSAAMTWPQAVLLIAVVVIPLTIWNLRQTRAGRYSNLDVSVRTERRSMYVVMLALMLTSTLVAWLCDAPRPITFGMVCLLMVFAAAAAANTRVKASLHTAVSFFLSIAAMPIDGRLSAVLIASSVLVAGSRLVLQRHTLGEIAAGAAIGGVGGVVFVQLMAR